jgi:hypothetical protein
MVTRASQWQSKTPNRGLQLEVQLPSGNTCLAIRPGMDTFLSIGIIPNSLMSVISKSIDQAQKGEAVDENKLLEDMMGDPQKLQDIMQLVDAITLFIVKDPQVQKAPAPGEPRVPDTLYVDMVDFEDKMFLFQWAVGGIESLETFRQQTG